MRPLAVAEIFGPTFQGEGPSTGRRAHFLRLGACNLACSWCDTPYTWDASRFDLHEEISPIAVPEVAKALTGAALLVITGGEPLLQAQALGDLFPLLSGWTQVEVETNGTLPPPDWGWRAVFNVSPKLSNSGKASALHPEWAHVQDVRMKFVVRDVGDLAEVLDFVDSAQVPPELVWIMPEGTTETDVLTRARALAQPVLDHGWNLTLRQHVLLWGDERGR